jgi:CDP-glucose 4,6-dehydratase
MAINTAFWQDRPTFVTGATGLVGVWLVRRLLEAGADVVCLVRNWDSKSELLQPSLANRVRIVRGDVLDHAVLERAMGEYEIDTVLHLAAQTDVRIASHDPLSIFETNIGGTWTLLEACRHTPTIRQIILASSEKAYGDQKYHLPYSEETPLRGTRPYDVSKSCADLIGQTYAHTYGLPVAISRYGNFYGGGDFNWDRIIPGTIQSILLGKRPVIRSDGTYIRDYFYVEDAAAAFMLLAEKLAEQPELKGQAFNFSNEVQVTVLELVERILSLAQSDLKPDIRAEVTNEILHQYLSSAKARKMLGWQPLFSLDEGLQHTIDWYRQYLGKSS